MREVAYLGVFGQIRPMKCFFLEGISQLFKFIQTVQSSRWVVSESLRPHGLQHARLPCPSPTPRVYSNSCPLSQWCHPTISSSVPFSSCPQSMVFSSESVLRIRWPKYWSFSFRISPSNEHSGLIFFRISLLDLLAVQGTQVCHYQNQGILSQSEFGPKNDLAPVLGNLGSWIAYQEKKEPVINWVS